MEDTIGFATNRYSGRDTSLSASFSPSVSFSPRISFSPASKFPDGGWG